MQGAKNTIRKAIAASRHGKQHNGRYELPPATDAQIGQATRHGLDISGDKHIMEAEAIRHVFRTHGNPKTGQARGQTAITDADLERIPEMLAAPDKVIYGLGTCPQSMIFIIVFNRKHAIA